MPRKKKAEVKRTYTKRKTSYWNKTARKGLFQKIGRSLKSPVHHYTRIADPTNGFIGEIKGTYDLVAVPQVLYTTQNLTYRLSHLPDVSDFSNLYDSYVLKKVTLKMHLVYLPDSNYTDEKNTSRYLQGAYPLMYIYNDPDDTNVVGSINEVRQNMNVKTILMKPDKFYTHTVRPAIVTAPVGTTSRMPKYRQRLDLATGANQEQWGTKILFERLYTHQVVRITATYHFSMHGVR